jgi:parallel beta-helix repeat protein
VLGVDLQKLSNNNYIGNNEMYFGRYGVTIESGLSNVITNNIMMYNDNDGIEILSSFNTISNNIITHNGGGIAMGFGFSNTVISNEISNNEMGMHLLNALLNKIQRNNIYNNEDYDVYFINSFMNRWFRNYWNDLIPPYRINGLIYIDRGSGWDSPPPIEIPTYNFDWFPALRPYKIEI